jgi:diguanylate cyclase (GGDEF)-like protein/PAS domain S-box-containing protein
MGDAFPAIASRASEPGAPASPGADRRVTDRRRGARRMAAQRTAHADAGRVSAIAPEWRWLAAIKATTLLAMSVAHGVLPSPGIAVLVLAAVLIDLLGPRMEQGLGGASGASVAQRAVVLLCGVVLPMALFGGAVAEWSLTVDSIAATRGVGALAVVLLASSVIASGRLPALIALHAGLWLGYVSVSNGFVAALMMLSAVPIAGTVFLHQLRRERHDAATAAANVRVKDRAQEILAEYEETGQGWFWETDREGILTYLSRPVGVALGRRHDELVGFAFHRLFVADSQVEEAGRGVIGALALKAPFADLTLRAATADGGELWWSIAGRPTFDDAGAFSGFRGSGSDLTEKRRSQEQASRLAHYDSLTGLANRFLQSQTLERILHAPRPDDRRCTVFLLDLDRFKQVNDTIGHPAGDALLKQVAERLTATIGEMGSVGRLGGDEFQVILPGRIERGQLEVLAAGMIEALSEPYPVEGHRVSIGASIGIALAPDDGVTSEALIRNADLALYAAKDKGRGCFHFYAADLHSDAEERRELEQDLRDAIASGGLELYYQPVVHTATERITGFEALLRWKHPSKGWISPAKFVPIAEDAGLIAPIGEWALRTACRDLAQWPDHIRVSVNVSALQFSNSALPAVVTQALAQAGVRPDRLELEITESVFLSDDEGIDAMFKALKAIGVRLALDDFGTGYSSLGYLKKAPFDKIKIDQSFVRGATIEGSRTGAIIASIVSLAEALGMETTAEGVETFDELDLVRALGCSHVQGYIYERPLSAANARARLDTGLAAVAEGPRALRAVRQATSRKVAVEHEAHSYPATVRNISQTGAMLEGLWNVPPGTTFRIRLPDGSAVEATARWSHADRLGVEFHGVVAAGALEAPVAPGPELLRRAG